MGYSYTESIGDDSTTTFTFSFVGPDEGYYDEEQIKVYVDNVEVERVLSGPNQVTLSFPPAASSVIMVVREPDITDTYTNFVRGNSFGKDNLNRSFQQALYLIQRIQDGFYDIGSYLKQALNMGNKKITNLAPGTDASDATNKAQYDVVYELATEQSSLSKQYAESASLSAASAATDAASAATDATSAAISFESFDSKYLGAYDHDPLVDNSGSSLILGALYFNISTHKMRQYTGVVWVDMLTSVSSDDVLYNQGSIGSLERTLSHKLKDCVSIKDFGAIGDGVTNDTVAFEALISYCSSTGLDGFIPSGVYSINPSIKSFTSSVPFTLIGSGRKTTVLKNRNTSSRFIYWTNANGVSFDSLTIDGSFTGSPEYPTSGGTLVFVKSNDNKVLNVDFINIWRVAIMVYNDHQSTLTNIYSGFIADGIRVYGPSNYINNVGPSAFVIADCNNSRIQNCYIENIGGYGYEYKNDCNNNLIDNCIAVNACNAIYFGGDGAHDELLFVKNSLISNCIIVDATSPLFFGLTKNNVVKGCEIRTTQSGPTYTRAAISVGSSSNSMITDVLVVNRKTFACDIRNVSSGNTIEFSLSDETYTGEAVAIAGDSTGNSATVSWKNHDTTVLNRLRFKSQNNVSDIRGKYFYQFSQEANPKIENALTYNRPAFDSTSKGRLQFGDTFDVFTCTNQPSLYEYFGDYTKPDLSTVRHKFDSGSKVETIYAMGGGSSVSYIKEQVGFRPGSDNILKLGAPGARWSTIYAGTGTISTSDFREKQQIRELSEKERKVGHSLKKLIRAFKFNDAVAIKGDKARIHIGVIAQEIKNAFEVEGLRAEDYSIICYDTWPEVAEEMDANGKVMQKYQPAGDRFGIRYEELLSFILATI